jgi:hypothetical protein
MAKDKKDSEQIEGVSVKEIEGFVKRYMTESFLVLSIIIATISSIFSFFTGPSWSVLFLGMGAVVSIIFPEKLFALINKALCFLKKQEKASQIIIGIVRLVIAIFIPFITFAELGLLSGVGFCHKCSNECKDKETKDVEPPNDGEHL